jgi:hypothetical protein
VPEPGVVDPQRGFLGFAWEPSPCSWSRGGRGAGAKSETAEYIRREVTPGWVVAIATALALTLALARC